MADMMIVTQTLEAFRAGQVRCECDLVGHCAPRSCMAVATRIVTNTHLNHSAALCADCAVAWFVDDTYVVVMDTVELEPDDDPTEDSGPDPQIKARELVEKAAHIFAEQNEVEVSWALRGFVDAMTCTGEPTDGGEYLEAYKVGVHAFRAAVGIAD